VAFRQGGQAVAKNVFTEENQSLHSEVAKIYHQEGGIQFNTLTH